MPRGLPAHRVEGHDGARRIDDERAVLAVVNVEPRHVARVERAQQAAQVGAALIAAALRLAAGRRAGGGWEEGQRGGSSFLFRSSHGQQGVGARVHAAALTPHATHARMRCAAAARLYSLIARPGSCCTSSTKRPYARSSLALPG